MKRTVAALLILVILLSIPVTAFASDISTGSANHFNVMLVVDATGSLTGARGSDPEGLRYDALKLFMGLLTEKGNNVGAIVFDNSIMADFSPKAMDTMGDKLNLARKIESEGIGTGGTTNIVQALDAAVDDLSGMSEKNGLPSVVLLLTDGNDNTLKYSAAEELKEQVIEKAREEEISINGILLNKGGTGNPDAIREYSDSTDGWFTDVATADDLADAFRRFYMYINNVEYSGVDKTEFDKNGKAQRDFQVPTFGVEEVNIVLDITDPLDSIELTDPTGKVYNTRDVESLSMVTSRYQLIKLPDPEHGQWTMKLKGTPGNSVDVKMLYNCSYNGVLSSSNSTEDYLHDLSYTFSCEVTDSGSKTITVQDLGTLNAVLCIEDAVTRDTVEIPMEVVKNGYSVDYVFDMETGSYNIYAVIGLGDFSKKTNVLQANIDNKAPVATEDICETIKTGLFQDGTFTFKLSDYFSDPEGSELTYTFKGGLEDSMELDGDTVTIDCKGIDEDSMKITAADEFGAEAVMEVELTENNVTAKLIIIIAVALALAVAAVIAYLAWRSSLRCNLEITIDTFDLDTDDWSSLDPVFNFHGKELLSRHGTLFGRNAKDCWFEATKDKKVCYFASNKPFWYGGTKTKKAEIRDSVEAKIYFNAEMTQGVEIEANMPF